MHDVADGKLNKTEAEGEKKVRNWLSRYSLTGKEKEEILKIIAKKRSRYSDDEKLIAYLCRQGFQYGLVQEMVARSSEMD